MNTSLYGQKNCEKTAVLSVPKKQSQTNPVIRPRFQLRISFHLRQGYDGQVGGQAGRDKANVGSLSNSSPRDLFDYIENLVLKTKLKILILQDKLDILPINETIRLIRRVQVIYF